MFIVLVTVTSSINGSINQLKSTRGYFFYSIKNNSNVPTASDLNSYKINGLTHVGAYSFGWKSSGSNKNVFSPCYNMPKFLGGGSSTKGERWSGIKATPVATGETCESSIPYDVGFSSFIKVATVFGICSASYSADMSGFDVENLAGSSISGDCIMR